jgi:ribosome-associated protein
VSVEDIPIREEMIRLGQLLKLAGVIDTGAEVKDLLEQDAVLVNGELETRRGRQLHHGDVIAADGRELRVVGQALLGQTVS